MPNGYAPTGEFQPYYEAALRRIRAGATRERRLAGRGIARAGVRTAGVGQIPITGITREQLVQERELAGGFGREQALTGIQERRIKEQRAWRTQQAALNRQWQLQLAKMSESARRRAERSGMWGQIIAGGLGAGGAVLGGPGGFLAGQQAGQYVTR